VTSDSDRSGGPVMLQTAPVAPCILPLSIGQSSAARVACSARCAPLPTPLAKCAWPPQRTTARTSAKSTLIIPGICTDWVSYIAGGLPVKACASLFDTRACPRRLHMLKEDTLPHWTHQAVTCLCVRMPLDSQEFCAVPACMMTGCSCTKSPVESIVVLVIPGTTGRAHAPRRMWPKHLRPP
jgi:hypothetical protein